MYVEIAINILLFLHYTCIMSSEFPEMYFYNFFGQSLNFQWMDTFKFIELNFYNLIAVVV